MSLAGLKKDLEALKEHVKLRPVNAILQTKVELLTDSELDKVLQDIPLKQIPSDILLTYLNREYGTSFKSIDDLPEECPVEWRGLE